MQAYVISSPIRTSYPHCCKITQFEHHKTMQFNFVCSDLIGHHIKANNPNLLTKVKNTNILSGLVIMVDFNHNFEVKLDVFIQPDYV